MSRYLLDTGVLAAYLKGRTGAVRLVEPWTHAGEAATSILVYAEVAEYLQGLSDPEYARHLALLRGLLQSQVNLLPLTFATLERYATLRRAMRRPAGPGLIGDIETHSSPPRRSSMDWKSSQRIAITCAFPTSSHKSFRERRSSDRLRPLHAHHCHLRCALEPGLNCDAHDPRYGYSRARLRP